MNRRNFIKLGSLYFGSSLFASTQKLQKNENIFAIKMHGDLDDDLIILKSNQRTTEITDIHQMHNPKGTFVYNDKEYKINHCPGYIRFEKTFQIKDDEVYCICLVNEREEEEIPLTKRIRTHYKNEKLLFNQDIFLPALMPEYDSVPGYPLWFGEDEKPRSKRKDINGDTYNYYNLFENTTVQFGIVVPTSQVVQVYLFNQKNEMMYSYQQKATTVPQKLKPKEKINSHPFTEINNILNEDFNAQIENTDYINTVIIEYANTMHRIPMPYPIMYPNLLNLVATR